MRDRGRRAVLSARARGSDDERKAYVNVYFRDKLATMQPPARGGLCVVGSSIMSMWPPDKLDKVFQDAAPIINYGVPGCQALDMPDWCWAQLGPTQPRVVLYYAGSNDLANGAQPEAVAERLLAWFRFASAAAPAARVVVCGVILAPQKLAIAGRTRRTNELYREITLSNGQSYVDPNGVDGFAAPDGGTRKELFLEDGLHLTPEGYDVLGALLTPEIASAYL